MTDISFSTAPCPCCGEMHPIDELELAYQLPDEIFELPRYTRRARAFGDGEYQTLDRHRKYVRALIPIPVHDRDEPYRIGAWVRVGPQTFRALAGLPAQSPTFVGRIANQVHALYAQSTLNVRVEIRPGDADQRPSLHVLDDTHALFAEQRDGIDLQRVLALYHLGTRAARDTSDP